MKNLFFEKISEVDPPLKAGQRRERRRKKHRFCYQEWYRNNLANPRSRQ